MTNTIPQSQINLESNGSKPILLDVRTSEEFEMQHLADSINLPLDELLDGTQKSVEVLSKIPKDSEIWIYCVSGARSSVAIGILKDAGYENVLNKRSILDL